MFSQRYHAFLTIAIGAAACAPASRPAGERDPSVLQLEELSYTDIDALDRERAVFVLTFGNLEEHGPHLPVGSDGSPLPGFRA
ncbi:MAG TPA: hypothetical protein VF970_15040 [Gemmatimonadales bacterium]